MLYKLLQFLMRQSLRIYYRDILVQGKDYIDKDKPLLIAATHPNSFLDAIILGAVIDRPLFFLARSDVFNRKWSDYILRKLNLIPIYRLQEGHNNLNKNDATFEACFEILERNGAVLIFAEGISLTDKKVRPPKKGLARIGFGTENRNDFKLNVEVLPVGINYEVADQLRNRILVQIAKPISLKEYQESFNKNANTAYVQLNEELYSKLKRSSIEVEDEEIFDFIAKRFHGIDYSFDKLKGISLKIQSLKEKDQLVYNDLKKHINKLISLEKSNQFDSKYIGLKKQTLLTILLLVPSMFGFILNAPPLFLANLISNKKVKLIEFYASVKVVLGCILWLIWASIIVFFIFPFSIINSFLYIVSLLLLGEAYLFVNKQIKISFNQNRYKRFKQNDLYSSYSDSINKINTILNIG